MSLTINTNINSLVAQNNLNKSQSALAQATERLSSGLKINSATDNAAGFAISTRFTTQIGGLGQASSNASDAINLAQTTQSALDQVTANLQAIRDLAVQSANGNYSNSDRSSINTEVQQRLSEITRIANQTDFNGQKVLDGSLGTLSFQVGANVGQTISVDVSQGVRANQVGAIAQVGTGNVTAAFGGVTLGQGDLSVNGVNVAAATYTSASSLASAINTAAGSSIASVNSATGELAITNTSTSSAITFAGAKATTLGLPATVAAVATQTTTGVAAQTGSHGYTLAAGALSVNGTAVAAGTYSTATSLASAIQTALGAAGTAVANGSNQIVITNTAASGGAAINFTATGTALTDLGIPASVAAASSNTTTNVATEVNTPIGLTLATGDLTFNGNSVAAGTYTNSSALATAINTAAGSTIASVNGSNELVFANTTASAITVNTAGNAQGLGFPTTLAADTPTASTGIAAAVSAGAPNLANEGLVVNGTAVNLTGVTTMQGVSDAINASNISGVSAAVNSNGTGINFFSSDVSKGLSISDTAGHILTTSATNANTGLAYTAGSTAAVSGSLQGGSVSTVDASNALISRIDVALNTVSDLNSTLGAIQNRFESTISTLSAEQNSLSASQSNIRDANFAAETANLSKANILQQAGISVLAQANAQPQQVLKLLQ